MEEGWRDRRQEAGPGGCVVVGGGARRGAEAGASWCRAPAARGSGRLSGPAAGVAGASPAELTSSAGARPFGPGPGWARARPRSGSVR